MTKHSEYAKGYQAALADMKAALDRGGESEAREWLDNNLRAEAIATPRQASNGPSHSLQPDLGTATRPLDGKTFRHVAGYAGRADVAIEVLAITDHGHRARIRFLEDDKGRDIAKGAVMTVDTFYLL